MGGCLSKLSGVSNNVDVEGNGGSASAPARSTQRPAFGRASASSALEGLPQREASNAAPPRRLAIKGDMLAQALNDARNHGLRGPLVDLAEHALEEFAANRQPGPQMSRGDIASLPALARAYNERYDGLNLQVMDQASQLIDALESLEPGGSFRAIVRLFDGIRHHFVADARGHAPGETTVVVLEPAGVLIAEHLPGYASLREQSSKRLGDRATWSFVESKVQNSFNDCVPFALHTALCAFKNLDLFDTWHQQLHATQMLGDADDPSRRFEPAPFKYLTEAGINVLDGQNFLPLSFFKHIHASNKLEHIEELRPETRTANVRTGSGVNESESIPERRAAFEVTRQHRKYSASIEGSRATKVRVALEAELKALREK